MGTAALSNNAKSIDRFTISPPQSWFLGFLTHHYSIFRIGTIAALMHRSRVWGAGGSLLQCRNRKNQEEAAFVLRRDAARIMPQQALAHALELLPLNSGVRSFQGMK
jgi:hypothetical protein